MHWQKRPAKEEEVCKSKCRNPLFPQQRRLFYFIFKYITEETACRRDLITFLSMSANSRLQLFFNRKLNPPENFSCVAKCTQKAFNRCVFIPAIRGAALWAGLCCVRLGWLKLQKLCHLVQNNCTQCTLKPFKNYIHYCHLSKSVALAALSELHVESWHSFFFYLHINMVFKKENHTQYKRKKKKTRTNPISPALQGSL